MSVSDYAKEINRYYRTILNWYHEDRLPRGVTGERLPSGSILIHVRDADEQHEVQCPSCGTTIRARMADA
jgi:hypothetical protein